MKPWNGVLAVLLLTMLAASSCATISPPLAEEEEAQHEEKSKIQEWLELQDLDLWRPWRNVDPGRN